MAKVGVGVVRVVGGRKYVVRADERLLARRGRWELSEYTSWSEGDWVSLKLFDAHKQVRRRIYQIGFNTRQGRAARNRHWAALVENYPLAAEWLVGVMLERCQRHAD